MKAALLVLSLCFGVGSIQSAVAFQPDHSKCTNCRSAADHKKFDCAARWLYKHRQRELNSVGDSELGGTWGNSSPRVQRLAIEAKRACGI